MDEGIGVAKSDDPVLEIWLMFTGEFGPTYRVYHVPTGASVDVPQDRIHSPFGPRRSPEEARGELFRLVYAQLIEMQQKALQGDPALQPGS